MAKPNPLQSALNQKVAPARVAPVAVAPDKVPTATITSRKPSRVGKVLIGGHFAPEVQTELKIIAAMERTTVQELLTEGLNQVFAKRGKPQIAALSPADEA